MSIKIESVEITPNPVNASEKYVISVAISQSTWDKIKKLTWNALKRFTWGQVEDGDVK